MTDISKDAVSLASADEAMDGVYTPTPFYTAARVQELIAAQSARITELEAQLAQAREREAGAYEAAAQVLDYHGDSASTNALGQQLCCSGHHCGCQGADVGSFLQHLIRALTPADTTAALAARDARVRDAAREVKPLVWDFDGRLLRLDGTMQFSKGYDWDGYECCRQEGYGLGCAYIIWPDNIGSNSWNVYGTFDGLYIHGVNGEEAAKAAAQADYEACILSALRTPTEGTPE